MTVPRKLPSQSEADHEPCRMSEIKNKTCQRLCLSEEEEEVEREPLRRSESAGNLLEHSQTMKIQLEGTLTTQDLSNNKLIRLGEEKDGIAKNLENSLLQLRESNELRS